MYDLLKTGAAIEELDAFFVQKVREDGLRIIDNQALVNNPQELIETLIKMKIQYNTIMEQACSRDVNLSLSVKKAFISFVNKPKGGNIALLLAKHVDLLMKRNIRGMSDEAISDQFDRTLEIFRLLNDKDEFESYFWAGLTKRLLNSLSVNDEAEKLMISKLKKECGCNYT